MGVDHQVRELAERSPNFGYLLDYEPVAGRLRRNGGGVLFADPNTAMIKCRQFGEVPPGCGWSSESSATRREGIPHVISTRRAQRRSVGLAGGDIQVQGTRRRSGQRG